MDLRSIKGPIKYTNLFENNRIDVQKYMKVEILLFIIFCFPLKSVYCRKFFNLSILLSNKRQYISLIALYIIERGDKNIMKILLWMHWLSVNCLKNNLYVNNVCQILTLLIFDVVNIFSSPCNLKISLVCNMQFEFFILTEKLSKVQRISQSPKMALYLWHSLFIF